MTQGLHAPSKICGISYFKGCAGVEHRNAVGNIKCKIYVMGDQDHGFTAVGKFPHCKASIASSKSIPGVGSSAMMREALQTKAVETSTLLAIPPESWKGYILSTSGPRLKRRNASCCSCLVFFELVGYRLRKEAIHKSTDVLLDLLKSARAYMVPASYLLFDSWFAFSAVIRKIREQKLYTICMLKSMPKVYYDYQGQKLTLNKLYATVRKKRGRAKILASVTVGIGQLEGGEQVSAKIVFVRDRRTKKKWLALLTTDTELPDEEVVRIYGKRWSIEVFFKMSKSYLKLAKEFQGRSYDSMVASTAIVFIRYIMLSLESRNGEDPRTIGQLFRICCDELKDISLAEVLQKLLTLLERFLGEQLQLAEQEIRRLIDYLIGNLPSFFKERLAICCCES